MENGKCDSTKKCCCPCHKAIGILIAAIGVTLLLGVYDVISPHAQSIAVPVILILIGLKNSIGKGKCKCCADA